MKKIILSGILEPREIINAKRGSYAKIWILYKIP